MKPEFALSLTLEGIRLLQRSDDGWLVVGQVALGAEDVNERLSKLRAKAESFAATPPLRSKLIMPNSEILYLDVDVRGATGPDYEATIREALDGRTPYGLDELSFDYVVTGTTAQIAVVARETLVEAEAFAVAHEFNPVCFAAIPPKASFSGEPMFGTTEAAKTLLSDDMELERDSVAVVVVGQALAPRPRLTQPAEPVPSEKAKNAAEDAPSKGEQAPDADIAAEASDKPAKSDAPAKGKIPAAPVTEKPSFASSRKSATAKAEAPKMAIAAPRAPSEPKSARTQTLPTPNPKPRMGLTVTAGLLVILLLVGAFAALTGQDTTPDAPAITLAPQEQSLGEPEAAAPIAPTDLAVAEPDPASQPLPDPAPQVMPEMDSALAPLRPERSTPFDTVALPEEVAEGEEASLPSELAARAVQPDPLAPAPIAGAGPGLLETETLYAVTGIWQRSPDPLPAPRTTDLGALYIASLDAGIAIDDALALPSYDNDRDALFETPMPPIGPGISFDLDADGLVVATPDGAVSPDGVTVFAGAGGIRPAPRPFNALPQTDQDDLASIRPAPRPENARELLERATLDGRSRAELAAFKPRPRPVSLQEEALAAADSTPSPLAVARAPAPEPRPSNIDRIIAEVRAAQDSASPAGGASASQASVAAINTPQAAPAIPTQASVARQATLENVMRLDRINLIGVYGSASDRRALVRTPSGRYVKLEVGDRFDGGRVAAIGESSMQYTKSGRSITLNLPNG
jgi:hypothetical protein